MIPTFFRVQVLEKTASTNDDARRAAEAGEAEGLVIQALAQTAGRGRQGRTWDSPSGNLYCSVLLRPACSAQNASLYTFAAALAIYDAVSFFLPDNVVQIKWPNDILVNDKKISGLLLETGAIGADGCVPWLVIGAGINVASFPENPAYPATCLVGEGVGQATLATVLDRYLERLDAWRQTLESQSFEPLRRAWLSRAKGGKITARTPRGDAVGAFAGLDDMGRLVLKTNDGQEKTISAADVFFGPA